MNVDIEHLAKLSRIELSSEELESLKHDIPAILSFVEAIQGVDISGVSESKALRNVMREDADAHESARFTEALLSQAPRREGDRIAVKQVISRK